MAQDQPVKVSLWRDSLVAAVGTTFTNYITIANSGSKNQAITLTLQTHPSIQFLSTIPKKLILLPGEKAMIPLKGLVNDDMNVPLNPVAIHIRDLTGSFF